MATARAAPGLLLPGGRAIVAGGEAAAAASAEVYEPAAGSWSSAGALNYPRTAHRLALLPSGQVLVIGGCAAADCATTYGASEVGWGTVP
jgi:large repetitive protein